MASQVPSPEECTAAGRITNPDVITSLGTPEKFVRDLSCIPDVGMRVSTMNILHSFGGALEEVSESLQWVLEVIDVSDIFCASLSLRLSRIIYLLMERLAGISASSTKRKAPRAAADYSRDRQCTKQHFWQQDQLWIQDRRTDEAERNLGLRSENDTFGLSCSCCPKVGWVFFAIFLKGTISFSSGISPLPLYSFQL